MNTKILLLIVVGFTYYSATEESILTETLAGHDDIVNTAAFSSDGKYLAGGWLDQKIILWNISDSKMDY